MFIEKIFKSVMKEELYAMNEKANKQGTRNL